MRRLPKCTVPGGQWRHTGRTWALYVNGRIAAMLTRKWPSGLTLRGAFSGGDSRPLLWAVNDGAGWPIKMRPGTRRQAMARAEQHAVWYAAQPAEHRKLLDLRPMDQIGLPGGATLVMMHDGDGLRTGYVIAARPWSLTIPVTENAFMKASAP